MKPFAWSFSKLKNFETCAYRHEQVDLKKLFNESSEQLTQGNEAHKALANACKGAALPPEYARYQKWVDRVARGPGTLLVEQQYAITKTFEPCAWFDKTAWFRAIGDAVRIWGNVGMILDWKTGKIKVDSVQLMLTAQCIFSHYPQVQKVRSEFVWLAEDCSTPEDYTRRDLAAEWPAILNRVAAMEGAYNNQNYPKNPGRLCRNWCPVKSCEHNGKGFG